MSLPHRPRVSYGAGPTVFDFTLPMELWGYAGRHHGGRAVSGAGIPEVYTIRREHRVALTLRFTEGEWSDVEAWIRAVMESGATFDFRFDQDVVATEYEVYLEEPAPGSTWSPSRGEFPTELFVNVVLRNSADAAFDVQAYP